VKLWYHLIAAVTGLALAALIVYIVFGNASEQGATQDGAAPQSLTSGGAGMCGKIDVAKLDDAHTLRLARENPPALFGDQGPIPAISESKPQQQEWVDRVQAAGGLCLDEVRIERAGTTISLSVVDGVDERETAAYAAGVLTQAFTPPFNPKRVTLLTTVGTSERTIVISQRAWYAYEARRTQLRLAPTLANLINFRKATAYGPADLRIVGWR
jgi:hypothetical protein